MNTDLKKYGLNDYFEQNAILYDDLFIARVSEQHRNIYKVIGEYGEMNATISGKFSYQVNNETEYPAVGDWVMVDRQNQNTGSAIIHHVLKRKSILMRQGAGTSNDLQIIATNIDTVFICMALNLDFNLRKLERYLTIALDSMATPIIVLTKSDLCDDLMQKIKKVEDIALETKIIVCSSVNNDGFEAINEHINERETIAFIGSSGVGKSTLINRLMNEEILLTQSIREDDDRGRHTTTKRQLLLLTNGGVVIDTPGMRELHIYTGSLSKSFEDIEELSKQCKYKNCSHKDEPHCMVKNAIEKGELSKERFHNYLKLQKEMEYEGLNSRQIQDEKVNRMFGSKKEMRKKLKSNKYK